MPAAVVAQIDDQPVALALDDEVAMELGVARRHHVGKVKIPDAVLRLLVYPAALRLHPVAIARRHLVLEQRDEYGSPLVRSRERQLGLGPGLVHEERGHRPLACHRLAIHRDDALADLGLDADGVQR